MYREITRERQPAVSAEVAVELREREAALAARRSEPTRPGDVYLSRRTADFPVEWLVVETAEDDRALVVALDDHPYAGSRDLELAAESLGGAAVVRCDVEAWIDGSDLEPELRTGTLAAAEVERLRRKRRAIDKEELEPSLLEEVVDGDPEYRRWREGTLARAVAALNGEEPVAPAKPKKVADGAPAGGRRRWRVLAAAAVLAALALPIGWQLYRLNRQLGDERAEISKLEEERRTLEDQLAASEAGREHSGSEVGRLEAALGEAREAAERALAEQQTRFDKRLRRAFDESVVVNVPSFVFGRQARTRTAAGQAEVIDPGGARRLTLSLEVVDPEPYPRYRLRVIEKAGGEEVWRTDELAKLGGRWLRLDLPADLFEAGEYQLLIYGLGSDEPQLLKERYAVKLER